VWIFAIVGVMGYAYWQVYMNPVVYLEKDIKKYLLEDYFCGIVSGAAT